MSLQSSSSSSWTCSPKSSQTLSVVPLCSLTLSCSWGTGTLAGSMWPFRRWSDPNLKLGYRGPEEEQLRVGFLVAWSSARLLCEQEPGKYFFVLSSFCPAIIWKSFNQHWGPYPIKLYGGLTCKYIFIFSSNGTMAVGIELTLWILWSSFEDDTLLHKCPSIKPLLKF